jgi:site-specific recombinase XerD
MPAKSSTPLSVLLDGYCLLAQSEGRSPKTISGTVSAVKRLEAFLAASGMPTDPVDIGPDELRSFIVSLQSSPVFSHHPYLSPGKRRLSGHAVNCYMRTVRAFWSWLMAEGIIAANPFWVVKVPKPPTKVVTTFSPEQFESVQERHDFSWNEPALEVRLSHKGVTPRGAVFGEQVTFCWCPAIMSL